MKHTMMILAAAMTICLSTTSLFAADEPNQPAVNPEVQKLMDRLAGDVDKLAIALPENTTEAEKGKLTEEFALLKSFVKGTLLPLCANKVFVQEVIAQNTKGVALAEIQAIDKQWSEAEDELPIQADFVGLKLEVPLNQRVSVRVVEIDKVDGVFLEGRS